MTARQFTLEPGGELYWLPSDARVETLVGTRYGSAQVTALTAGMSLLIPRGGTRDELYARLLHAAYQRRGRACRYDPAAPFSGRHVDPSRAVRHMGRRGERSAAQGQQRTDWPDVPELGDRRSDSS